MVSEAQTPTAVPAGPFQLAEPTMQPTIVHVPEVYSHPRQATSRFGTHSVIAVLLKWRPPTRRGDEESA